MSGSLIERRAALPASRNFTLTHENPSFHFGDVEGRRLLQILLGLGNDEARLAVDLELVDRDRHQLVPNAEDATHRENRGGHRRMLAVDEEIGDLADVAVAGIDMTADELGGA